MKTAQIYTPRGVFITQNEKEQYIYSDFFTEGGYIIPKKGYQKYRTYALRYFIGAAVIILLSSFIKLLPSLLVGILTIISGEALFRIKFLKKTCIHVEDFNKETGKVFIDNIALEKNRPRSIIKIILYIAFGILIVINAYDQGFTGSLLYVCWGAGIIAIIIALVLLVIVIKYRNRK